jgi:arylsulfatase A-like enzyme
MDARGAVTGPSPPQQPSRRNLLRGLAATATLGAGAAVAAALRGPLGPRPPNIVLLLTDDQGYNDLGCYYTPPPGVNGAIATPEIDALAARGVRLTSFYVASSVCSPSRAALLTGCYPPRIGFGAKEAGTGVFSPQTDAGLATAEVTLADLLRGAGYRTGCFGKWHLGHKPPFLPTAQGFDEFLGIPWSANQRPLPLLRGTEVERPLAPGEPIDPEFAREAIAFVHRHRRRPFFLYVAFSATHEPLAVLPRFVGASGRGPYADSLAQTDALVGGIVAALADAGVADHTVIVFASDNGPVVGPSMRAHAWPFRGGKGDVWEGGFRSPCVWVWPGVAPAGGVVDTLATAMDVFPTCAALAGTALPPARIDGHDLRPVLEGGPSAYAGFAYYSRGRLGAVRGPRFKRMFADADRFDPIAPALYDLAADPGETTDVRRHHPSELAELDAFAERMRGQLGDALQDRVGRDVRPLGHAS